MENLFERCANLLEQGEYNKIFKIIYSLFILIAPSFSFIFIYKKDLFNNLDNIKLILLCLILNIIIFMCFYVVVLNKIYRNKAFKVMKQTLILIKKELELKLLEKDLDNLENLETVDVEELDRLRNKCIELNSINEEMKEFISEIEKKDIKHLIIVETSSVLFSITTAPFIFYFINFIFKFNLSDYERIRWYFIYIIGTFILLLMIGAYLKIKIKYINNKISKLENS